MIEYNYMDYAKTIMAFAAMAWMNEIKSTDAVYLSKEIGSRGVRNLEIEIFKDSFGVYGYAYNQEGYVIGEYEFSGRPAEVALKVKELIKRNRWLRHISDTKRPSVS